MIRSALLTALAPGLLALAVASGAMAQTSTTAPLEADLVIQDGVQISTLQRTTVASASAAVTPTADPMIDAVAVIQISGDPDRAYRIRLPKFVNEEGHALVEALSAHSQSRGDMVNESGGAMNGDGKDVIQLKGRLRVSEGSNGGATTMPLSVDIE